MICRSSNMNTYPEKTEFNLDSSISLKQFSTLWQPHFGLYINFDLYLTYILWWTIVTRLSFLTTLVVSYFLSVAGFQTHFWMKPSSILILGTWHVLSTPDLGLFTILLYLGHALLYVSHIVFWSFIPEWKQPDYTRSSQITIIGEGDIVRVNHFLFLKETRSGTW